MRYFTTLESLQRFLRKLEKLHKHYVVNQVSIGGGSLWTVFVL